MFKLADGLEHGGEMDVVDLDAASDVAAEGDGEAAAEVFAELLEALEDNVDAIGVEVGELVGLHDVACDLVIDRYLNSARATE